MTTTPAGGNVCAETEAMHLTVCPVTSDTGRSDVRYQMSDVICEVLRTGQMCIDAIQANHFPDLQILGVGALRLRGGRAGDH